MEAGKENAYAYNKALKEKARRLRNEATKSEACLWKYVLRARAMRGYQFRRQRPVLNYIADFMCKELKLIIELDGLTHTWEETVSKDLQKQKDLEAAGFTILRFDDELVLNHIGIVKVRIEEEIERLEKELKQPRS